MIEHDNSMWQQMRDLYPHQRAAIRKYLVWDTAEDAYADESAAVAIWKDTRFDETDRAVARDTICRARLVGDALAALELGLSEVPVPAREELLAGSVAELVIAHVEGWVDPFQAVRGLPPNRDDLLRVIIPWFTDNWRHMEEPRGLCMALARMLSEWPDDDVDALEPLIQPLADAARDIQRQRKAARLPITAGDKAILWDIVEWQTLTGRTGGVTIKGLGIMGSPTDITRCREARRLKRELSDEERQIIEQANDGTPLRKLPIEILKANRKS